MIARKRYSEEQAVDQRINTVIAEKMKNAVVREYIKSHPGTRQEEVFAQYVNGKWVVQSVTKILGDIFKNHEIRNAFSQQKLLEELDVEGDDRYRTCQDSVHNSKRIVDFLFQSRHTAFGLSERTGHLNFLSKEERFCAEAIYQYCKNIKEIIDMMAEEKPLYKKMRLHVRVHFDTLQRQLKSQLNIFDREVTLNNEFSKFSQGFIESHYNELKSKIKSSEKKKLLIDKVSKVYQILKKNGVVQIDGADKFTVDQLRKTLQELDQDMITRRMELDLIQKVIAALEKIVAVLEGSQKERPISKPPNEKTSGSSHRMAFGNRLSKMFGRFAKGIKMKSA